MKTTLRVVIDDAERVEVTVKGAPFVIVVEAPQTTDIDGVVDGWDVVMTHESKAGDDGVAAMTLHREKVKKS